MNVNPMFVPAMCLSAVLFAAGFILSRRLRGAAQWALTAVSVAAALPAVLYLCHYLHLMGEPMWYYRFRAVPYTELLAAGAGLIAGRVYAPRGGDVLSFVLLRRMACVGVLVVGASVPFIKPLLMPLDYGRVKNVWRHGVCIQSTMSTCGPCSAATLMRRAGLSATEEQVARAAFTHARGTENWYLARHLRKRGLEVRYVKTPRNPDRLPCPAIAGVRPRAMSLIGHFISVLESTPDGYVVADPLFGKKRRTMKQLREEYVFTGFFMVVEKTKN